MADNHEEAANVTAFDALYTTNQIQKLKVLLPYIEPSMQKNMAVYIKYMELQYTMHYVRRHPFRSAAAASRTKTGPTCSHFACSSVSTLLRKRSDSWSSSETCCRLWKPFRKCRRPFSALQEIFPDMSSAAAFGNASSDETNADSGEAGPGSFSMMDMLMNMLTPEQREMYEMFQQQNIE